MPDSVTVAANTLVKNLQLFAGLFSGAGAPILAAPYFQRQVDAAVLSAPPTESTIQNILSPPATVLAGATAVLSVRSISLVNPLIPIAKSSDDARADQGFCLRWVVPGIGATTHEIVGQFFFGQFRLDIFGDGTATLSEDINYVAWQVAAAEDDGDSVDPDWRVRDSFRYCRPNQVTGCPHSLVIFPVLGPNGEKYINFASADLDAAQTSGLGLLSVPGGSQTDRSGAFSPTEHVFRWDEAIAGTPDQTDATTVTVAAKFWLLESYALRCHWQVSKLGFWAAGYLYDQPWAGTFSHPNTDYAYAPVQKIPTTSGGAGITATIFDSLTGSTSDILDPYLRWDIDATTDVNNTPVLWGYSLTRAAVIIPIEPGPFDAPFTQLALNGAAQEPRREGGSASHQDPANNLTRLATRGELSLRISTTTPTTDDGTQTVTLFRGYGISPHKTKLGRPGRHAGAFGRGSSTPFPSADWGRYEVTFAGMWLRLAEGNTRSFLSWEIFARDAAATPLATGYQPPWKITDAIKYLIQACGFPDSMIGIPDLDIRFYPGVGSGGSNQLQDLSPSVAEQCVNLAREYLGRWLAFDPTAGVDGADGFPVGQWILLSAPPPGDVTPVWHFVEGPDSSGLGMQSIDDGMGGSTSVLVLPHMPLALPASTTAAFGDIQSWSQRPEANHLWGFCMVDPNNSGGVTINAHIYNFLSFKVPGSTVDPDPESPHYVGRERLAFIGDPMLWAGAQSGSFAQTQYFLNYVMHRFFYAACLARQYVRFAAPLTFIKDGTTGKYRSLRFYDPVTWQAEEGWFISSVSPENHSDRLQVATYELTRVVPYLVS